MIKAARVENDPAIEAIRRVNAETQEAERRADDQRVVGDLNAKKSEIQRHIDNLLAKRQYLADRQRRSLEELEGTRNHLKLQENEVSRVGKILHNQMAAIDKQLEPLEADLQKISKLLSRG